MNPDNRQSHTSKHIHPLVDHQLSSLVRPTHAQILKCCRFRLFHSIRAQYRTKVPPIQREWEAYSQDIYEWKVWSMFTRGLR